MLGSKQWHAPENILPPTNPLFVSDECYEDHKIVAIFK